MSERLSACDWPELAKRYDSALREAVAYIFARFDPTGVVACGSIIRGNPDARSDFDLYVIHDKPFRQRLQRVFGGYPTEIFVNSPGQIREYFAAEQAEGRPCTAHMLSNGFVIYACDAAVEALMVEARRLMTESYRISDAQRTWLRYAAVDTFDNAKDLREVDAGNAELLLCEAIRAMLEYAFLASGQHLPRPKELLRELDTRRPAAGRLARACYGSTDLDARFDAAERLASDLLGVTTFFEWESEPEQPDDV